MSTRLSQDQYNEKFGVNPKSDKQKCALESALDIRKFEIGLYWTRATYFWTFIGIAFGAYGAVQTINEPQRTDLSVFLSCIGLVFSFAWYCVNRGSKQWQENWENHVDLLEDDTAGPLYKVVLQRDKPKTVKERVLRPLVGPAPFSVSKINQLTSVYICIVWVFLYFYALPEFSRDKNINAEYVIISIMTLGACWSIGWLGRTQKTKFAPIATIRETRIADPPAQLSHRD